MKAFITYIAVAPLLIIAGILLLGLIFVVGITFLTWDLSVFSDAISDFISGISWAKVRVVWVVCVAISLLILIADDSCAN